MMEFEKAVELMSACPSEIQISASEKLSLYANYKQATLGDCSGTRPSFYQVVEKAKYDAYNELKGVPIEEAKRKYVFLAITILERVKDEYPLIAQQLSSNQPNIDQVDSNSDIQDQEESNLNLIRQNKSLSVQLKWMKRLSLILFLVVILQLKLPFKKLIQFYLKK
eukprot:NODE_203_length_12996_cov_1.033961.p9 type:complete len:166 gc:universal NODE_203_length_12996_cov_1.033961:4278-3781(-)